MKTFQECNKGTLKILKPNCSVLPPYRMYTYCDSHIVGNSLLLFNLVTTEVICLDQSDFTGNVIAPSLDISNLVPDCRNYLLSHRFIVNENNEDWRDVEELRYIMKLKDQIAFEGFQFFTILPTTDCNARCYYCFESGYTKITMDEKTAIDTADFILKNCSRTGKKDVCLSWYGGEPLYNDKAIDIISRKLTDAGIGISSSMISNGLLLDAQECRKAVDLWKLRSIQITLDGTEKIYNKTKAYIGGITNAFAKVLSNIQGALDAGIEVSIRLNVSKYNVDDLFLLADELASKFPEKRPYVYAAILFLNNSEGRIDDRSELEDKFGQLKEKLRLLGFMSGNKLPDIDCSNENKSSAKGQIKIYKCIADNPNSVIILPDGRLHSCDMLDDSCVWGSIYTEGDKYTTRFHFPSSHGEVSPFDYWSECRVCDQCHNCKVYPYCVNLLHCPGQSKNCDSNLKERILYAVERKKQRFIREAEQL